MAGRARRTAAGVVAGALVLALVACSPPSRAESYADELARDLGDRLTPQAPQTRTADFVAAQVLESSPADDVARIDVLDWSGRTDDQAGARVLLRIRVTLPGENRNGLFQSDVEPSSATRCVELTVRDRYGYDRDAFSVRATACPDGGAARIPDPATPLRFPDDAEARLLAALADATAADVASRVREVFPEPGYAIAAEEAEGELVVAIALWSDCLLAVRHRDGSVTREGFDPMQIKPGETGCRPALYLRPVVGN